MLGEGKRVVDSASERVLQRLQVDRQGQGVDAEEEIVRIVEEDSPCESVTLVDVDVDCVCSPICAPWIWVVESIGPAIPRNCEVLLPKAVTHQRCVLLEAKFHKDHLIQTPSIFNDASGDISSLSTHPLEPVEAGGRGDLMLPAPKSGVEGDDGDGRREYEGRIAL